MTPRSKTMADAQLQAYGYAEVAGKVVRLAPLPPTRAPLLPALRPRQQSEEEAQVALYQWREVVVQQEPRLQWLHHIPNGKYRTRGTAGRLKGMGTKRGVSDNFLPVPSRGFHGYYLELKAPGGILSPEQWEWLTAMVGFGYHTSVDVSWVEAAQQLCWYLERMDMVRDLGGLP